MIAFEICALPKMTNGGHGSWKTVASSRKRWRSLVGRELHSFRLPHPPWTKGMARLTRYSCVEPDFDGLVSGFKAIVDALVFYGIMVDDRPSCFNAQYLWEKCPRGKGKIRIEVWEQLF